MRKRTVAVIGAVVTLALSGCGGGPSGGYTFNGVKINSLDSNLGDVEKAWRAQLDASQIKPRYGTDARCYVQVLRTGYNKDSVLGPTALCGPFRGASAPATQWSAMPLHATSSDGGDTGTLASSGDASVAAPETAANYTRSDGKKPDLNAVVDEPDAPAAKAGDVLDVTNSTPGPGASASARAGSASPQASGVAFKTTDGLKIPGWDYVVATATSPRAGVAAERKQAPSGGTFLYVSLADSSNQATQASDATSKSSSGYPSSTNSANQPKATWAVKAGGQTYQIPLPAPAASSYYGGSAEQHTYAIALPTDGSDATVQVTYDGLTQELDASGKRAGSKGAGLYQTFSKPVASMANFKQGDGKTGLDVQVSTSGSEVSTSAYDTALKWPGDGKLWAAYRMSLSIDSFNYHKPNSTYDYARYSDERTILDGGDWKCGDTPAKKVIVDGDSYSHYLTVICELPAKAGDYPVSGSLKLHGKLSSSDAQYDDYAPTTQDVTVKLAGTINLR